MATDSRIRPLTPELGAQIPDVDLARLSAEQFELVERAFVEHAALLFRGQTLDEQALVAFSRRFGELDQAPVQESGRTAVDGFPEIYLVSNIKGADGKAIGSLGAGEAVWHTDMSYIPNPPYASVLYAVEVPPVGGNTWLASMYAAYDALPAALKERARALSIKHDGTYNSGGFLRAGVSETDDPMSAPGEIHPLVLEHPRSGRPALYLGRRRNAWLVGLPLAESERLLDELWTYVARPEHSYEHVWRVGDVLMWDNRATMHRRDPFDPAARRLMKRTQIKARAAPERAAAT